MILPWKIRRASQFVANTSAFLRNVVRHVFVHDRRPRPRIAFVCGFHRTTGATVAIAGIANLLAERFSVLFTAPLDSDYNRLLDRTVQLVRECPADADLYIVDGNLPLDRIGDLRRRDKKVLVTAHGVLPADSPLSRIAAASATHFVGTAQLTHHETLPGRHFIIPNHCPQVVTRPRPGRAGLVGRVRDPKKNIETAIRAALLSNAEDIQVWGGHGQLRHPRVKYHEWGCNKREIYGSFAVLLSLSLEESFGLTVIEAMSAGIPCVLSDIAVTLPGFHVHQFRPPSGSAQR